jgi:hypothetical protein
MANSIEIFENTLLKLLIRRGTDTDRQNILFNEGELGYTIDTKRLYVGDGSTVGGIPVAGSTLYTTTNLTSLHNAIVNDLAYNNDDNNLYLLSAYPPTILSNWKSIGGKYTAGDNTIVIDDLNQITVGTISGSNIDLNGLAGEGLAVNGTQLELASAIKVDIINPRFTTNIILSSPNYITLSASNIILPTNLVINTVPYAFPNTISSGILSANSNGTLIWVAASSIVDDPIINTTINNINGAIQFFSAPCTIVNDTYSQGANTLIFSVYPDFRDATNSHNPLSEIVPLNATGLIIDFKYDVSTAPDYRDIIIAYAPTVERLNTGNIGLGEDEYLIATPSTHAALKDSGQLILPLSSSSTNFVSGFIRTHTSGNMSGRSGREFDLQIRALGYTY